MLPKLSQFLHRKDKFLSHNTENKTDFYVIWIWLSQKVNKDYFFLTSVKNLSSLCSALHFALNQSCSLESLQHSCFFQNWVRFMDVFHSIHFTYIHIGIKVEFQYLSKLKWWIHYIRTIYWYFLSFSLCLVMLLMHYLKVHLIIQFIIYFLNTLKSI